MKQIKAKNASMMALSLAALGVVFGDIGTSPLYAIREIFTISNNILALNESNMLGILSIIFWSLIFFVRSLPSCPPALPGVRRLLQ